MGAIHPPESFTAKYGVDETLYVDDLPEFLAARTGTGASGAAGERAVHAMQGMNTDSGNIGPPLPGEQKAKQTA